MPIDSFDWFCFLEWVGWGSLTLSGAQFLAILGWHAFQDSSHLDWVSLNVDTVLGSSPFSLSFLK